VTAFSPALLSPSGPWNPDEWAYGEVRGIAYFDLGSGPVLHAWGTMGSSGSTPPSFDKLNTSTYVFAPATGGVPGLLTTVMVFDSGAGPQYHAATQNTVWRWNGSTWVSLGATVGTVTQLVVHDDGSGSALYAAGNITSIGGVPVVGVARWNGTSWSTLPGLSSSAIVDVTSLASLQDASGRALFAGGNFTDANGTPANGVARWNGAAWSGFGSGLPFTVARVAGLESFDLGTGDGLEIVVSAQNSTATQGTIASWNGSGWTDLSALPGIAPAGGMPILAADLANTPGRDLVALLDYSWSFPAGAQTTTWVELEACALTGELNCIGDGSQIACPCGNESAPSDRAGCLNSLGIGGSLRGRGRTSLTSDTAQLDGGSMPNGPLLYFQGTALSAPFAFGDGIKCTGGALIRLGIRFNAAQSSTFPGAASPNLSTQGLVAAPGTRHYQARYRDSDSFCTSDTFSYTNGVALVWQP